jgi:hypothetical protein
MFRNTLTLEALEDRLVLSTNSLTGLMLGSAPAHQASGLGGEAGSLDVDQSLNDNNAVGRDRNPAGAGQGGRGFDPAINLAMMLANPAERNAPPLASQVPPAFNTGPDAPGRSPAEASARSTPTLMSAPGLDDPGVRGSFSDGTGVERYMSIAGENDLILLSGLSGELGAGLAPVNQGTPLAVAMILTNGLPESQRPSEPAPAVDPSAVFGGGTPADLMNWRAFGSLQNATDQEDGAGRWAEQPAGLLEFIGGLRDALKDPHGKDAPRQEQDGGRGDSPYAEPGRQDTERGATGDSMSSITPSEKTRPERPEASLPEPEVSAQVLSPLRTSAVFASCEPGPVCSSEAPAPSETAAAPATSDEGE